MTEALMIDPALQEKLESEAHQSNRNINELLNDAIAYYLRLQDEKKLEQEIGAFEMLHNELWRKYPMEWVAIHGEKLVDHDEDKLALYRRIRDRYPNIAVLLRQVKASPIEEIWMRTPSTGKIMS